MIDEFYSYYIKTNNTAGDGEKLLDLKVELWQLKDLGNNPWVTVEHARAIRKELMDRRVEIAKKDFEEANRTRTNHKVSYTEHSPTNGEKSTSYVEQDQFATIYNRADRDYDRALDAQKEFKLTLTERLLGLAPASILKIIKGYSYDKLQETEAAIRQIEIGRTEQSVEAEIRRIESEGGEQPTSYLEGPTSTKPAAIKMHGERGIFR